MKILVLFYNIYSANNYH